MSIPHPTGMNPLQGDEVPEEVEESKPAIPAEIEHSGKGKGEKSQPIPDQDAVIAAISKVHDPEIPVNIYALGLIYLINLHDNGDVEVEMTLTAPNCPSAQDLPIAVQQAVQKVPYVKNVRVDVVWDPPWDISRMSDEARLLLNLF